MSWISVENGLKAYAGLPGEEGALATVPIQLTILKLLKPFSFESF
jgi:hypothetical protein